MIIKNFTLTFQNKLCFEDFSAEIRPGDRIAIIGRNGSGKSSLLKMIYEANPDSAYVPQIITEFDELSGGERFNKSLSKALGQNPSTLLLDEPTNHLDRNNRKSLMKMLMNFRGTLIMVTHDEELIEKCSDIIWHINNGKITIFCGKYRDYIAEQQAKSQIISSQIHQLEKEKKTIHERLMKEQEKTAKSRAAGQKKLDNKKWMKSIADLKAMKAEKSQGKNIRSIEKRKSDLSEQLDEIYIPKTIVPKFTIPVGIKSGVSITDGTVSYQNKLVLSDINLSLSSGEKLAIVGRNGSGKTTLIRAIMNDPRISRTGTWLVPRPEDIGYLDQHYGNLNPEKMPFEAIQNANPNWKNSEIRGHLNDFLFRKNEEVFNKIKNLSGGEKARLSLAIIAARVPKLLILDEITNNIDLETKTHIADILKAYPSSMIIISHDQVFLDKIGETVIFEI